MNLALTVTKKENMNMSSLIKQMCSLKCRVKVDSINGTISIIDMDDNNVERIIDAISEAFEITSVDIVPSIIASETEKTTITEDSIEFDKMEVSEVGEISTEKAESNTDNEIFDDEVRKTPIEETTKDAYTVKKISAEDYVANIIADALNSLDKSKPVEEQVDGFLTSIGWPQSVGLVRYSFIATCYVDKVCYESILMEVWKKSQISEEVIKKTLKKDFNKWLSKHPNVKENYPKISIMSLLKVFAKKMA